MRLYIDSSVLLQFRPLDEFDWCALAGIDSEGVELVIIPAVLREVEAKKVGTNRRLNKRADRVIQQFERLMSSDNLVAEIRGGVRLRIHTEEPRSELRDSGLNESIVDDWIIATILEDAETRCALVTDDLGLRFKAHAKKVRTIRPPAELRLPPEEDEELRKLREENRALKQQLTKRPQIEFTFGDGSQVLHAGISIPRELTTRDLEKMVNNRRKKLLADAQFAAYMWEQRSSGSVGASTVNTKSVDDYLVRWRDFQVKRNDRELFRRRSREIELVLANEGEAPASGIEISLSFPEGVMVGMDPELVEEPSEPIAPRLVETPFSAVSKILSERPVIDLRPKLNLLQSGLFVNGVDRIWQHSHDGRFLRMSIDRLLQTKIMRLDRFWLAFPIDLDASSGFTAEYKILISSPADVISGSLSFVPHVTVEEST